MPLETVMLCLDSSSWMRNSDYSPTRLGAQYDAAATLIEVITGGHPEASVGLLAAGGAAASGAVRLLASPTHENTDKLYAALTSLAPGGGAALPHALRTAMVSASARGGGAERAGVTAATAAAVPAAAPPCTRTPLRPLRARSSRSSTARTRRAPRASSPLSARRSRVSDEARARARRASYLPLPFRARVRAQ